MSKFQKYLIRFRAGQRIEKEQQAIEIRYGKLDSFARVPRVRVDVAFTDFFHANCDVAIIQRR
jgi:hypothetical protein